MVDTRVDLCGITLDNPVIPASGTFGYGYEFGVLYDINCLGTFSFKGTTLHPRFGNETPRIAECPSGEELPRLAGLFHKPVMANVSGFSPEEYAEVVKKLDRSAVSDMIGWYEINISCPNVHGGGMSFGTDPNSAAEVVRAVRWMTEKPIIIKLSPNVTDITEIAKACETEGADAVSLINTMMGMRIDLKTKRPVLANVTGGLSGPAVFPVALRMVYQTAKAVNIPVIGMGGVSSAEDVLEMMMAGAVAVEVGAANLVNPYASRDIVEELPAVMAKYGISRLKK